jgi:TonB family protein
MSELFLESLQPVAFIFGPLLVLLVLIFAFIRGRQARDWLFPAAISLALLSVTGPVTINAFVYIGLFRGMATEAGNGGIVDIQGAAACGGLLNGVIALIASLCVAAIAYLVLGVTKPRAGTPQPQPAGGLAVSGMSLAIAAVTLLAGLLVWLHLGTIDTITFVSAPVPPGGAVDAISSADIATIAARLSRNLQMLLLGGVLLSVLNVAVATLTVLFQRRSAQTLVAAGIAFAAVIGAGWTAVMLKADMREIDRVAATRTQTDMIKDTPAPEQAWLTQPPPPPQLVAPTKIPGEIMPDNTSGGVAGGVVGGIIGGIPEAPPPPPPPPSAPLRVAGNRAPERLKDVQPVYPELARRARVEDIISLDAVIGPDGKVRDVRVLRGHPLLVQAAVDAVRQWEFAPTLVNGKAVPVVMAVTVTFKLN